MNAILYINPADLEVTVNGDEVRLTRNEFKLLVALFNAGGKTVTRAALLEKVWGAAPDMKTRTIDMTISRVKRKLGEAGVALETIRGFGYRLNKRALVQAGE